jgi:hypothetical protein
MMFSRQLPRIASGIAAALTSPEEGKKINPQHGRGRLMVYRRAVSKEET